MKHLEDVLRGLACGGELFLAYSGGLDSRFAAHAAQRAGISIRLVHAVGPHVPASDSAYALDWAMTRGLSVETVSVDPLSLAPVAAGERGRCYACKREMLSRLVSVADGRPLCDGTNASDAGLFRPGMRALAEFGIASPLLLAGFDKGRVRASARLTGLEDAEQQARPCLLTRFPYGMPPTRELLGLIEESERMVSAVFGEFFKKADAPDFRVRCVSKGRLELHADRGLPPHAADRLNDGAARLGVVLPVRIVENVSGFFDD